MATQVKIKRGTTDATAPSGLTAGEMAINLVDKKLYVGGTAGTNVIFLDSTSSVGLGTANTFTALNSFNAGISASGGTFTSDIHIVNTTTYTELTVGFGGGGVYSNMAFGREALKYNTIGGGNAAIGFGALASNTEGGGNIALGSNTLVSNTTGSNNIAIGGAVLYWAPESSDNIAIGNGAMQGSFNYSPGLYNIGIGTNALKGSGFTGEANVAIGYDAVTNASTGSYNVAIGFESLRNNSTGLYNTSVGSGALRLGASINPASVSQMTALGYQAGRYRGTGTSSLVTGTGGIYIGYQARGSTANQTNEIVIGVDALGLGSNTAVIGATLQSAATIYGVLNLPSGLSASGATFTGLISGATATFSKDITVNSMTVGLGSGGQNSNVVVGFAAFGSNTNGIRNVAVGESALVTNTEGSSNVGVGRAALYSNTTGGFNIGVGRNALYSNTEGSNNVGVGRSALSSNTTGSFNVGVGYGAGQYIGTGEGELTTGTGGIYIGYQARGSTLAQTNEIVIGVDALGLGSNTAVIGATLQSAATIYGVLNLPSGLSASGATLSGTVITSEKVNAITSARTVTVNFQDGNIQTLTGLGSGATGSSAIGFTGASATGSSTVTMIITNGGLMTSNTTFWSTAVKWPGGFKTTLSTSGVDILTFTTIDAGTNIYGMLGGKAFS